ncbi:MAG: O-antigen ligase family protein [Acidimicrobiia bacterium]|nr:O-antigen ligase family protein [Acidimicrobiia bacterium]
MRDRLLPLVVVAVPVGAFAALGGAYSSSVLPLLAASSAALLLSGARIGARGDARRLDVALVAFLCAMALQIVPLPATLVAALSPGSAVLQAALSLDAGSAWRTLSIHPAASRETFGSAASVVFLYWAASAVFTRHGGVRLTTRVLAWSGLIGALVGLAQRATAPNLLLWIWEPIDPGGRPFGPFVNRNHFAMWLLMAGAVVAGAAVAHFAVHRVIERRALRYRVRDLLADGTGIFLAGAAGLIWLTLIASTSRGAILGLMVTAAAWVMLSKPRARSGRGLRLSLLFLAALLAAGVWANVGALVDRFTPGSGALARSAVWHDTVPILRDFPLTGTGAGTYAHAMLRYQRAERRVLFNEAHSEYVQLAAEGGLLLVVPALLAMVAAGRLALVRLQSDLSQIVWIRVAALSAVAGVAVQCLSDSALRMPANAMLFALLVALICHRTGRTSSRSRERGLAQSG